MFWVLMLVQRRHPASALVARALRRNPISAVYHRALRQYRHVAGALRDRRDESAPRFHAVGVGHVFSDVLGLGDAFGQRSGLFLSLLFLFVRLLPMISISEVRELVAEPAKANAL